MGMYAPFFFVESYVIRNNILSENMGFYLLSIMNGTSLFGRIFPNAGADKTGPLSKYFHTMQKTRTQPC